MCIRDSPGFGSNMRWQPASGLGLIVLANHRYAPMTMLARDVMNALLASDAVPARLIRPSAAMAAAHADCERLLSAWDDDLANRLFAMNVELDEPLALRRAELERIRDAHGPLHPDAELPSESETPLFESWWLAD